MTGRKMRISLPEITTQTNSQMNLSEIDQAGKRKQKQYADQKRQTEPHNFQQGNTVLVRQPKKNKLSSPFDPKPYSVTNTNGSMITAQRGNKKITRNSSHFKHISANVPSPLNVEEEGEESDQDHEESDQDHEEGQRCDQGPRDMSQFGLSNSHRQDELRSPTITHRRQPEPSQNQTSHKRTITRSGRVVKPPNKYTV